jgi:hypothetical protein
VTAWLRRHIRGTLATAAATAAISAAVPLLLTWAGSAVSSSSPPKCPGAACEGKDPNAEGCAVDALTFWPALNNPVHLEVRYSKRCGAAWGRIKNGQVGDAVTIAVKKGGTAEAVIASYHDKYTNMVTVDSTFRATVCALPTNNPDTPRPWKPYCIQATEKTNWTP